MGDVLRLIPRQTKERGRARSAGFALLLMLAGPIASLIPALHAATIDRVLRQDQPLWRLWA